MIQDLQQLFNSLEQVDFKNLHDEQITQSILFVKQERDSGKRLDGRQRELYNELVTESNRRYRDRKAAREDCESVVSVDDSVIKESMGNKNKVKGGAVTSNPGVKQQEESKGDSDKPSDVTDIDTSSGTQDSTSKNLFEKLGSLGEPDENNILPRESTSVSEESTKRALLDIGYDPIVVDILGDMASISSPGITIMRMRDFLTGFKHRKTCVGTCLLFALKPKRFMLLGNVGDVRSQKTVREGVEDKVDRYVRFLPMFSDEEYREIIANDPKMEAVRSKYPVSARKVNFTMVKQIGYVYIVLMQEKKPQHRISAELTSVFHGKLLDHNKESLVKMGMKDESAEITEKNINHIKKLRPYWDTEEITNLILG